MFNKMPSNDCWSEQFEYITEEDESLSELEDEPDFSEYMWMEHEEEFDQNELQRLEEEDIMKECIEAMLEDELEAQMTELQKLRAEEIDAALSTVALSDCNVEHSILNPMAAEFIPQSRLLDSSSI